LFEFRKKIPKKSNINRVFVYSSYPISAITGEFHIDDVLFMRLDMLWEETNTRAGICELIFRKYFENNEFGYALKIFNAVKYPNPIKINNIGLKRPPQSFMYINTEQLFIIDGMLK
jgi:predicted transcriptional regulator